MFFKIVHAYLILIRSAGCLKLLIWQKYHLLHTVATRFSYRAVIFQNSFDYGGSPYVLFMFAGIVSIDDDSPVGFLIESLQQEIELTWMQGADI